MAFNIALNVKAKNGVLQQFIDEMGWTQSDFARAIDGHVTTVGLWFNLRDYPHSPLTMDKVTALVGKSPEEIFPEFLRNPEFLSMKKKWTLYREVDLDFLPFNQIPQIEYTPDYDGFDLTDKILQVLHTLSPKESDVIKRRYGFSGYCEQTLEEIARDLSITRERVRQIECKAIRKLKHPTREKILKQLVEVG